MENSLPTVEISPQSSNKTTWCCSQNDACVVFIVYLTAYVCDSEAGDQFIIISRTSGSLL